MEGHGLVALCVFALAIASSYADHASYIFNGKDVDHAGKYPWQASIQTLGGFHFCGGVLIDKRWVLTARHCTVGQRVDNMMVHLGVHDIKTHDDGDPHPYRISEKIEHKYCGFLGKLGQVGCDFALLKLAYDADLSSPYIQTVALPEKGEKFDKAECVISGWGSLNDDYFDKVSRSPNVLQELPVKVQSGLLCKMKLIKPTIPIVCVKGDNGGSRPGDSGGPLSCKVGDKWKVAGVCSFGMTVMRNTFPSAYAEVAYAREWIRQHTGV